MICLWPGYAAEFPAAIVTRWRPWVASFFLIIVLARFFMQPCQSRAIDNRARAVPEKRIFYKHWHGFKSIYRNIDIYIGLSLPKTLSPQKPCQSLCYK